MSFDHDEPTTGIDPLQELGKQLPWDRPDASRREAVRSSLLVAANETTPRRSGRAMFVGAGFVAGALAAAAVALIVIRTSADVIVSHENYAQIESSSVAELEHTSVATSSGTDEVVRIRAGTVRLAVPAVRNGDRVRTKAGNAEVEGTGAYEVVVTNDRLTNVRVSAGSARIVVDGQKAIFLASGETWSAPIVADNLIESAKAIDEAAKPADLVEPTKGIDDVASTKTVVPTKTDVVAATSANANQAASAPNTNVVEKPARGSASNKPAPVAAPANPQARGGASSKNVGEIKSEPIVVAPPGTSTTTPSTTRTAPPSATSTTTTPAPAIVASPTPPPTLARTGETPTERHFRAGWAMLRDDKFSAAADELALAAAGDGPLASDARYFQAVALTKAGRAREAEAALVAFLDRAPTSTRRGRAAVMLGRLIVGRGDAQSARAWFTAALTDPDASVAGAAKAELAKIR